MNAAQVQPGDILRVRGEAADEYALVLSPGPFNRKGRAFVAPIEGFGEAGDYRGFAVALDDHRLGRGAVLIAQARSLDLRRCDAHVCSRVGGAILGEALLKFHALFDQECPTAEA